MIGRRLSFIVSVISSPPGSHTVGQDAEPFDLLHPRQFLVALGHPGGDPGDHLRVSRQSRGRRLKAVLGRIRTDRVGVEDQQRGVVRDVRPRS